MSNMDLVATAHEMVAEGKGLLAIDESTPTCQKRFDAIGVECTEDTRRAYREMLITTPGLGDHISGVILYDETLRQATSDGVPFIQVLQEAGIMPGIKVDAGAHPLAGHPNEKVTEGLDGLRERLSEYAGLGAKFAKWRAVITIGDGMPTGACLEANAHALARYAALCQEANIVPIVEPEVLMDGDHGVEECYEVTEATLRELFSQLYDQNVMIEGIVLKASMIVSGSEARHRAGVGEVARATVQCLLNSVPASIPGIVFLSGGQADEEATAHLDSMNRLGRFPWALSFSYGRALQAAALRAWGNDPEKNIDKAQIKLAHRARMNGLAAMGKYDTGLEAV